MIKGVNKSIRAFVFGAVLLCGFTCFSKGVYAYDEKAAQIKGGRTNIRSDASTGAGIVTSQSGGFKLTVVDEKKDSDGNVWYKVTFSVDGASKTGFIMSDFVTITGNATPASSGAPAAETPASVSVTDLQVEVEGVKYNIAASVPKDKVPEGFTEFNAKYDGKDITVVKNKETNVVLAYLVADGNEGLFEYDQNNSSFKAYGSNRTTVTSGSSAAASSAASKSSGSSSSNTELEELKFQRFLMMVAISAEAVVILVLIIALALKGRKGRDEYDDFDAFDDDDDEYDDEEDYEYDRKYKNKSRGKADPDIDKAVQNIVAREEAERARSVEAAVTAPKSEPRPAVQPVPQPAPQPAPRPAQAGRSRLYDNDYNNADIEPDDDYRPASVPPKGTDPVRKADIKFEEIDFDDL